MRTESSHKALAFAVGTFMLFGGYFAYASYLSGIPSTLPFIQTISAKDGEDDSNDEEDDKKDEEKEKEKAEKEKEKAAEKKKKEDEKKREDVKKAAERAYKSSNSGSSSSVKLRGDGTVDDDSFEDESEDDDYVNGMKLRGDGSVDDDAEENEVGDDRMEQRSGKDEREAMYKDRTKTLERVNEKIAQAEEKILEKQAEGVDVTAALAELEKAKVKVAGIESAFATGAVVDIKSLVKEVERLAHFSRGKVLKASEDVAEDVAKVAKRIAQTEEKIAYLKAMGGDATSYESSLSDAKSAFADAKAKIALGGSDLLAGLTALEVVERRVKSIKNSVEGALLALGVSDDDEFEAEHDEDVEDAADDLVELAEADEDHLSLKNLAKTHKEEAIKVSGLVSRLGDRSRIVRGLVGNDSDILNELQNEVAINEARIVAMQTAVAEIEDESLSELINEKIGDLKSENAKLANFISSQSLETGVFGWFFKLF